MVTHNYKNFKLIEKLTRHVQVGTTSNEDCRYLFLLCETYKPKKILEIGTFVGKSTYSLSLASNSVVYTIDENEDKFIELKPFDKNIIRYPNTHSNDFWKLGIKDFDFIFADGFCNYNDIDNIFEKTTNNFIFVTHDFSPLGKGEQNIFKMKKYCLENDIDYKFKLGGEYCAVMEINRI